MHLTFHKTCKLICLLAFLLPSSAILSQISITGPTCGTAGTAYQYTISGSWTGSTNMQWCVTGGTISTTVGGTYTTGCKSGTPLPNVYIKWGGTGGTLTLNTLTPTGSASKIFSVSTTLVAGSITANGTQNITYNATPATVSCSPATGGGCSPSYSYQWQQSPDNVSFTDLSGVTTQNLAFSSGLTVTTYYRGK